MKKKHLIAGLAYLLLSSLFQVNEYAWGGCEGNPPGTCYHCVGKAWEKYGDCVSDGQCTACQKCNSCVCEGCILEDCEHCVPPVAGGSCQCYNVNVVCYNYDCCIHVGEWYGFSAGAIPNFSCISWYADEGDPETGTGNTFWTRWNTPGLYGVTVSTTCGSTDTKYVSVCDSDQCCINGDCVDPICENCHSINDTAFECGHYVGISTTCASDWCIIDELDTATCDYHPNSQCPSNCKVEAVAGQPAVWQRVVQLNYPNCLTGGEPVQYEDWHKTYQGCETCLIDTFQTSCETFGCPGTVEYSAPRGDKKACAGSCQ